MTAPPHDERSIFLDVLELPPEADRGAFLDAACGGNRELRAGVEALLRAHDRPQGLLDAPDALPPTADGPGAEQPGDVVGRYKLLERIGEGGMGAVWMAEQREPVKRLVAVKLIKAGMDSRAVLTRFEAERQALALMDHPNIAKVLDGGTTAEGRPFFVMELVKGLPLTEYCDARRLTVRDRLELFAKVCAAVQHAHQKGVLHRDLKPSNVLVTEHDGKPVPKVIDFGLAKALTAAALTDKTLHTAFGSVVGTPLYMAPEQVGLNALDVDTRTDVYALGVILYELLTGTTPLEGKRLREAAWDEMRRLIREEEPPRPSLRLSSSDALPSLAANRQAEPRRLTGLVRGELDWIALRALEKDRNRRYESATAFAADVGRYLAGEAVQAVPPSAAYRLRKAYRRNRGPVLAAGAVLGALLAGLGATSYGFYRADTQRRRAETAESGALASAQAATTAAGAERLARDAEREAADLAHKREAEAKAAEARAVEREKAEKQARAVAEEVTLFMQEVFAGEGIRGEAGRNRDANQKRTVKEAMDRAARTIGGRFANRPGVEAVVRTTIGTIYRDLGAYAEARSQLERALELATRGLGPDHPDTLRCTSRLGHLYQFQGALAAAEPLFQRALAGYETAFGPDHMDTLRSLNNLAGVYFTRGNHAAAEPLFRRAIAGFERTLGPDHPDTLLTVHNLALLCSSKGDFAAAGPLFERALAGHERAYGPDHPNTLVIVQNLAGFHQARRDYAAAEPLHRRALAGFEKALGPDHPDTLRALGNLATLLSLNGNLAAAEPLARKALAGRERTLGSDHPDTLASVNILAGLLRKKDEYAAAEPLYRRALDGWERSLGPNHPDTVLGLSNLGDLYFRMGRYAEAVPLLDRAVQGSAGRPELAVAILQLREELGLSLVRSGRPADAEPHLLAVYNEVVKRKANPTSARRLGQVTGGLVALCEATNQLQKAAKWRAERAQYPPEIAPPPRPAGR